MSDIITKLQRMVWAEKRCWSNEVVLEPFGTHIDGLLIDSLLVGGVISYIVPIDSVRVIHIEKPVQQTNIKHI